MVVSTGGEALGGVGVAGAGQQDCVDSECVGVTECVQRA